MTKFFCDRCDAETTGAQSGHVIGIDDADEDGSGDVTTSADLCADCYLAFLTWLDPAPAVDAVDPHADNPGPVTPRGKTS